MKPIKITTKDIEDLAKKVFENKPTLPFILSDKMREKLDERIVNMSEEEFRDMLNNIEKEIEL